VPRAVEAEQVAVGWPPWLVAVAPEAVRGWVPRRAESFEKLDKVGPSPLLRPATLLSSHFALAFRLHWNLRTVVICEIML
jgi:hypothetical protein